MSCTTSEETRTLGIELRGQFRQGSQSRPRQVASRERQLHEDMAVPCQFPAGHQLCILTLVIAIGHSWCTNLRMACVCALVRSRPVDVKVWALRHQGRASMRRISPHACMRTFFKSRKTLGFVAAFSVVLLATALQGIAAATV